MARLRATASAARSVLDGREHDGMLDRVGPLVASPLNRASEATPSKNVLLLIRVHREVSRVYGRRCLHVANARQTDSALLHAEDKLARHLAAPFFKPTLQRSQLPLRVGAWVLMLYSFEEVFSGLIRINFQPLLDRRPRSL